MKQLVSHNIRVKFIDPFNTVDHVCHYNVADINISRQCGREIGQWLAKGPGYQVHSETTFMLYVESQREQAHAAKIRQQQQDSA